MSRVCCRILCSLSVMAMLSPLTSFALENGQDQNVAEVATQTVEKISEQAAEKAAEIAASKTVEKMTEETVDKVAEKAAEKVTSDVVQKAVEQAVAESKEEAEQKARRPDEWWGATKVHFLVFIVDIDAIDDANQNFTANIYLRLRWKDRRLADRNSAIRQVPLESVWNPRVLLANQTGLVPKSLPDVVQVQPDGTVTYHQRYTGELSQILRLTEFPRDKHEFVVQFVAAGYGDDQLEFVPDTHHSAPSEVGGAMAKQLSLPDWRILEYEASKMTYQPIPVAHTAGFGFRFKAERYITYYLWQVVLPLGVVVIMSWTAFWIKREDVGVRIGIATSSVLTLIAHRFVLASLLPKLPYMTRIDYLTVGSTLLVLLSLFMVTLVVVLDNRKHQSLTRQLDIAARVAFPSAFLLLLGWFLFGTTA